jgi:hypothetical protein
LVLMQACRHIRVLCRRGKTCRGAVRSNGGGSEVGYGKRSKGRWCKGAYGDEAREEIPL